MALTQMQIIQSLGEAMAWFEREMNWGVPPTELRHLSGRIGELYAALITNGQMATDVNQKGYDVVSAEGERISVKTTATMGLGGHVAFNPNSLASVDRVIVLRINTEEKEIETLLNVSKADALNLMAPDSGGKRTLSLGQLVKKPETSLNIKVVKEVIYEGLTVRELENGSIEAERGGEKLLPVKPTLRQLAVQFNVGLLNSNGNPLNTRQLGTQVIKSIEELAATETQPIIPPDLAGGKVYVDTSQCSTVIGNLFNPEPETWGLRGDPFLWRQMQRDLLATPLPATEAEFDSLIFDTFLFLSGKPISTPDDFHVEAFAHGGMSSGVICPAFWREQAIPLLKDRFVAAQPGSQPGAAR